MRFLGKFRFKSKSGEASPLLKRSNILGKLRITPKIMMIVIVLNLMTAIIGALSFLSIADLARKSEMSSAANERLVSAMQTNQAALSISRLELMMAAVPTEAIIRNIVPQINAQFNIIEMSLSHVASLDETLTKNAITEARNTIKQYRAEVDETVKIGQQIKGKATPEQIEALQKQTFKSRAEFENMRYTMDGLKEAIDSHVQNLQKDIQDGKDFLLKVLAGMVTGIIVLGCAMGMFIGQSGIAKPVRQLRAVIEDLSQGNFHIHIPGVDRRDEVGDIARAAEIFKVNGTENERLRQEQEASKRAGEEERRQLMHSMADQFDSAVGSIVTSVSRSAGELKQAAVALSASAEGASNQSTVIATSVRAAESSMQSVAVTTEELVNSVSEISKQTVQSSSMAQQAVTVADSSAEQIRQLSEKTQKIGEIVEMISSIASQTNLLALNATIEAARAGDAGRGFAVVASEVKSLADQTARATVEIGAQIAEVQNATGSSTRAMSEISDTIRSINEVATAIAGAVEEQNAATQEIARNIQQASDGTSDVTVNIAGVTQEIQATSAASGQVLSAADQLMQQADQLRAEMDRFLATVRAA